MVRDGCDLTFDNHVEWGSWQPERDVGNSHTDQCSQRAKHLQALLICEFAVGSTNNSMCAKPGGRGLDSFYNIDL